MRVDVALHQFKRPPLATAERGVGREAAVALPYIRHLDGTGLRSRGADGTWTAMLRF